MAGRNYGLVAEALVNFRNLNNIVNEISTVENARSELKFNGNQVGEIGDGDFSDGFSVRYKNIETYIYEHNGMVVADPYINIFDNNNEEIMEAMYIEDLESGIYSEAY